PGDAPALAAHPGPPGGDRADAGEPGRGGRDRAAGVRALRRAAPPGGGRPDHRLRGGRPSRPDGFVTSREQRAAEGGGLAGGCCVCDIREVRVHFAPALVPYRVRELAICVNTIDSGERVLVVARRWPTVAWFPTLPAVLALFGVASLFVLALSSVFALAAAG